MRNFTVARWSAFSLSVSLTRSLFAFKTFGFEIPKQKYPVLTIIVATPIIGYKVQIPK